VRFFRLLLSVLYRFSILPDPIMRCAFISAAFGVAVSVSATRLTSLGSIFEGLYAGKSQTSSFGGSSSSRYGVDKSFPMHHPARVLVDNPLGGMEKNNFYNEFINGCRENYAPDGHLCDITEEERIEMNLRQPAGMVNYTELGFAKVRAPDDLVNALTHFWTTNHRSPHNIPNEIWPRGNTYTNHWSAPTKMLQLGGEPLRSKVWDMCKEILQSWTGVELSPSSLYGVRVYTQGAVLAPHVDRMPLVISAIVNVAQDIDENWPLEVIGHDGMAHNITILPGEMILYESASVIHGRPFPLRGRYYANVFIHFEPSGHGLKNDKTQSEAGGDFSLGLLYQQAWKKQQSECSKLDDDDDCKLQIDFNMEEMIPPYIIPGSEESKRWIQRHPHATLTTSKERVKKMKENLSELEANFAAASGDLKLLKQIAKDDPEALHRVDKNGWSPLTEAARGGHQEVLEWLLQEGANINQRTHKGNGGSPLWWAKKFRGTKHKIVAYMEKNGAVEIPPEGHEKIKS
jgi:prolyl 4-hydroxylase